MEKHVAEVLTEDNYLPLAVQRLTPQELKVKEHWARFRPKTTAALSKSRTLDLTIRKLVHRTEFAIAMAEVKTGLTRVEIEPMFRDQLYPPPEQPALTPDTE